MFQIYVFSALLTSPVSSFPSIYILKKHALKNTHTAKKKKKKKSTHRQDVVVTGMFCDSSRYWISVFSTLFNVYNTLKHATGNFNIHHRIDPAKSYVLFLLLFTEPKLWPIALLKPLFRSLYRIWCDYNMKVENQYISDLLCGPTVWNMISSLIFFLCNNAFVWNKMLYINNFTHKKRMTPMCSNNL